MSDTETNRKLVTAAFEGWRDRNEHVGGLFADRMTWRIENSSLAAGDYAAKADFFARVLTPFGARFAGSDEPFQPVRIHQVVADGDTVVVYFDARGVASDGSVYENTYAWFLTLEDGQVVHGTAFFDGRHFDEFWNQTQP